MGSLSLCPSLPRRISYHRNDDKQTDLIKPELYALVLGEPERCALFFFPSVLKSQPIQTRESQQGYS